MTSIAIGFFTVLHFYLRNEKKNIAYLEKLTLATNTLSQTPSHASCRGIMILAYLRRLLQEFVCHTLTTENTLQMLNIRLAHCGSSVTNSSPSELTIQ